MKRGRGYDCGLNSGNKRKVYKMSLILSCLVTLIKWVKCCTLKRKLGK